MARNTRFAIALEPRYLQRLDEMAEESGKRRAELATSILKEVLEDDAEAHGEPIPEMDNR